MFLVMTTRQVDLSLEEFYVFMFLLLSVKVILYKLDNPGEVVFRIGEYRFASLPFQAVAGIFVALGATSLLILTGTYRPIENPVGEFVTQALFVAFVETYMMVVLVTTVWARIPVRLRHDRTAGRPALFEWREIPAGLILWPLVFGFLHPAVRLEWLAGNFTLESLLGFSWGVVWALLFYALFRLRDGKGRYALFFGAVTAWVAHIVANLVILTYRTKVGAFEFFPVEVGAVASDLIPYLLLYALIIFTALSAYHLDRLLHVHLHRRVPP